MISNICMISKIQPAIYKSIAANLLEMVSGDLKPKAKHRCECVIILIPDLKINYEEGNHLKITELFPIS